MKNLVLNLILFSVLILFTQCEIVGDIFKAGMYWGIFLVVAVIIGIVYLIFRGRK
jgi:hypothetical protein